MLFVLAVVATLVASDPGPTGPCSRPVAAPRKGEAKGQRTQPWVREARHLLHQLRQCGKEAKPHLWAWQIELVPREVRRWTPERKTRWLKATEALGKLGQRVYAHTWRLWQVTGHPPFNAIGNSSDNLVLYLPRLEDEYRIAIEKRKHVSESEVQYRGVLEAAAMLTSGCWRAAVVYLEDRIDFVKRIGGGEHPLFCGGPMPTASGKKARAAYTAWIKQRLSTRNWDATKERFRSADCQRFDNKVLRKLWYEHLFRTQTTIHRQPTTSTRTGPTTR